MRGGGDADHSMGQITTLDVPLPISSDFAEKITRFNTRADNVTLTRLLAKLLKDRLPRHCRHHHLLIKRTLHEDNVSEGHAATTRKNIAIVYKQG